MNETKAVVMPKIAQRVNRLVDVRVNAEPPSYLFHYRKSLEDTAKDLEGWANDFHAFLRDHRSQDIVALEIERIRKDVCSVCNNDWETDTDDVVIFCAHCGALVEDHTADTRK